ncbi:hypothetical protein GG344DRAFT_35521, partial [Lentinula edodes]
YLQYDINWASITLLYYDWLLTLPEEIKYVWKAKLSRMTIYYIFCRYALLANVLYLLAISNLLGSRVSCSVFASLCVTILIFLSSLSVTCDNWMKFVAALSVVGRAAIIVTLISRTYVVCSQNRWIAVYLIVLGLVCVVAD